METGWDIFFRITVQSDAVRGLCRLHGKTTGRYSTMVLLPRVLKCLPYHLLQEPVLLLQTISLHQPSNLNGSSIIIPTMTTGLLRNVPDSIESRPDEQITVLLMHVTL